MESYQDRFDGHGFDGHDAQRYFASHLALPVCVVVAYLAMVWWLPRYMAHRPAYNLRATSRIWNLAVAVFSICGAMVCVPHLFRQLTTHGFYYTVCHDVYELAGYGRPAFWAALFTWSKLLELVDTVLIILRKRKLIMLHWFHHASVIIFAWAAWVYETPAALWYGAMNYTVHAIMYTYFALTSISESRCCHACCRSSPRCRSRSLRGDGHQHVHGRPYMSPTVTAPSKLRSVYISGLISRRWTIH